MMPTRFVPFVRRIFLVGDSTDYRHSSEYPATWVCPTWGYGLHCDAAPRNGLLGCALHFWLCRAAVCPDLLCYALLALLCISHRSSSLLCCSGFAGLYSAILCRAILGLRYRLLNASDDPSEFLEVFVSPLQSFNKPTNLIEKPLSHVVVGKNLGRRKVVPAIL